VDSAESGGNERTHLARGKPFPVPAALIQTIGLVLAGGFGALIALSLTAVTRSSPEGVLSFTGSILGSALGTALAIAGALYVEARRRREETTEDRTFLVAALRQIESMADGSLGKIKAISDREEVQRSAIDVNVSFRGIEHIMNALQSRRSGNKAGTFDTIRELHYLREVVLRSRPITEAPDEDWSHFLAGDLERLEYVWAMSCECETVLRNARAALASLGETPIETVPPFSAEERNQMIDLLIAAEETASQAPQTKAGRRRSKRPEPGAGG
jgi:hypothetical protein